MIKLIGLKRLILLSILIALNLGVAGFYLLTLQTDLQIAEGQLASVTGEIADLQGKISTIKDEMAYLQSNLPKFQELQNKGFFLEQDRFMIGRTMEDLRVKTGVASFAFEIADVEQISNADADAMEHRLVNSRIKVDKIVSPLDVNIYTLMQEMSTIFPEYARLQSFEITRTGEVTEQALKDITAGQAVSFVDAKLTFDWMTLVPKEKPKPPAAGTPGFRGQ